MYHRLTTLPGRKGALLIALLLELAWSREVHRLLPDRTALTEQVLGAPLLWEPNVGQSAAGVQYLAHPLGGTLFFTADAVILELGSADALPRGGPATVAPAPATVVRLQFVGAQRPTLLAGAPQQTRANSLAGHDQAGWHPAIPTYRTLTYHRLYPGVDLTFTGHGDVLKLTYLVAPGADPTAIHWRYSGATTQFDAAGNLQLQAGARHLTDAAPIAWQVMPGQRVPVTTRYVRAPDGTLRFALGAYDPTLQLFFDPGLRWAPPIARSGADSDDGITVDHPGASNGADHTDSLNFPTPASSEPANGSGDDTFVSKVAASGHCADPSSWREGPEWLIRLPPDRGRPAVQGSLQTCYPDAPGPGWREARAPVVADVPSFPTLGPGLLARQWTDRHAAYRFLNKWPAWGRLPARSIV